MLISSGKSLEGVADLSAKKSPSHHQETTLWNYLPKNDRLRHIVCFFLVNTESPQNPWRSQFAV